MLQHKKFIFDNYILPTLWQKFGDSPFLLQRDCAAVHKARSTKTWFDQFSVEERKWSAQSPDLNLILHFSYELECCLQARPSHPTTMPNFKNAVLVKAQFPTNTLYYGRPSQKGGV